MNWTRKLCGIFVLLGCTQQFASAAEGDIVKNSSIVHYELEPVIDSQDRNNFLISDYGEIVAELDYQKCIRFMKDISQHHIFNGADINEIIEQISDNVWLIYYFTNNPWPIPDSDNVVRMTYRKDTMGKKAIFSIIADSAAYPRQGIARMDHYQVEYIFRDLGSGMVKISFTGQSVPPVRVPKWLIELSFPKLQEKSLKAMVEGIANY